MVFFFFQAEDGIRDDLVTGVQTCALPIWPGARRRGRRGAGCRRRCPGPTRRPPRPRPAPGSGSGRTPCRPWPRPRPGGPSAPPRPPPRPSARPWTRTPATTGPGPCRRPPAASPPPPRIVAWHPAPTQSSRQGNQAPRPAYGGGQACPGGSDRDVDERGAVGAGAGQDGLGVVAGDLAEVAFGL